MAYESTPINNVEIRLLVYAITTDRDLPSDAARLMVAMVLFCAMAARDTPATIKNYRRYFTRRVAGEWLGWGPDKIHPSLQAAHAAGYVRDGFADRIELLPEKRAELIESARIHCGPE